MIEALDDHYARLRAKVAAMRVQCRAGAPDSAALSHARHQLMTASLARSRFLKDTVYPALLGTGIDGIGAAVDALDRDLSQHRADVSLHVSTWTPDRIAADWTGYRAASARLMRKIEDRIRREQAVLMPTLAALHTPTPA
jgi:hypothetical protein